MFIFVLMNQTNNSPRVNITLLINDVRSSEWRMWHLMPIETEFGKTYMNNDGDLILPDKITGKYIHKLSLKQNKILLPILYI